MADLRCLGKGNKTLGIIGFGLSARLLPNEQTGICYEHHRQGSTPHQVTLGVELVETCYLAGPIRPPRTRALYSAQATDS